MNAILAIVTISLAASPAPFNTITPEEQKLNFKLLFDSKSLQGWEHKGNWIIDDGALYRKDKGGDITYTVARVPDDFELRFDWKVSKGCNSGVYYRPGQYEYQVLDNANSIYGENPRQSAASLFFCMAPSKDVCKPFNEWNEGRIMCQGTVIQHWLNGAAVIDFDYTDPRWQKEIEILRIRGGNLASRGAFLKLQDHGQAVWFRNIRLRTIPSDEKLIRVAFTPMPIPEIALQKEAARIQQMLKASAAKANPILAEAKLEKVASGCRFTEGPAADAEGNLFFTDSPNNRIMVLRPDGTSEVWNKDSRDANGMAFDAAGRLIACCGEGGARAVVRFEKDGKRSTLAERYNDKRLTAPNDLCVDRQGRIYFTDPCYGGKPKDAQEKFAVYRIEAENGEVIPGKVTRVIDDVEMPNGVAISTDNKTLYVADNSPRKTGAHTLLAYDILPDGSCKRRGVLHDFKDGRGIDGMRVDTQDRIYATAGSGKQTGVYIFSPKGEQLGFIQTPETATNCTFGDRDLKTLYITAGTSLYRIRVDAVGFLPYPPPR